jgi:hypothetical protein
VLLHGALEYLRLVRAGRTVKAVKVDQHGRLALSRSSSV